MSSTGEQLRPRNGNRPPNDGPDLTDPDLPWYIYRANNRYGPYSFDALQKSIVGRILEKNDFVWCPGLSEWKPVQEIEGLFFPPNPAQDVRTPRELQTQLLPTDVVPDNSRRNPAVAEPNASKKKGNIITTHWRGEFSLGASYWINGLFITFISTVSIAIASQGVENNVGSPSWMFLLSGLLFLTLPVTIWQLVGIWRSANRHQATTGRKAWANAAKVAVILGSLKAAAGLATAVPMAAEYATMAVGDKYGKATFRLVRNGTEMEFSGGISSGLSEEFSKFIEAAPQLEVVHLESIGGRIAESKAIAKLIRQRGLSTYVSSHCESACTYMLLGGAKRWAAASAKIGFHSPSFAGLSQADLTGLIPEELGYLIQNGVERKFAETALATSSDKMWYPSIDEMLAAHVLTGVATSNQFAASGLASLSDAAKARETLERVPLYAALRDIYPNESAAIIRSFSEGIKIGKSEDEVIAEVQQLVLPLVSRSLPNAEAN